MVAAVYRNRLRIGMALQCDPTVIYGLQRHGKAHRNLRREDLAFGLSASTRYRYPGLPPGPIAAPGQASLEAAIHPANADYLYFVSRNDGSHAFARTLEEHNRNVPEISRPLPLAPLELFSQHFEVAPRRRTNQPEHGFGTADTDFISGFELVAGLPIEGHEDFVTIRHEGLHTNW